MKRCYYVHARCFLRVVVLSEVIAPLRTTSDYGVTVKFVALVATPPGVVT